MPKFRTQLSSFENKLLINHEDYLFSIGSCFAQNIGELLATNKFNTLLNPFGILYNPASIAKTLMLLIEEKEYIDSDLFQHQGLWNSFDHHSQFSGINLEATLASINRQAKIAKSFLSKTTKLIITLGTAHVFVHNDSQQIVANCHKLPNKAFSRVRLSTKEVIANLSKAFEKLHQLNPDLEIITTVSPVRHIRDGLVENQKSKATLLLSLDALCQQLDYVHYFPAYELVVDDLRDYRFYEADMIHPNQVAIDYIWEYFSNNYFDATTKETCSQINNLVKASKHRPFQSDTPQHQLFVKKQLEKIEDLKNAYPHLDFEKEVKVFSEQLSV